MPTHPAATTPHGATHIMSMHLNVLPQVDGAHAVWVCPRAGVQPLRMWERTCQMRLKRPSHLVRRCRGVVRRTTATSSQLHWTPLHCLQARRHPLCAPSRSQVLRSRRLLLPSPSNPRSPLCPSSLLGAHVARVLCSFCFNRVSLHCPKNVYLLLCTTRFTFCETPGTPRRRSARCHLEYDTHTSTRMHASLRKKHMQHLRGIESEQGDATIGQCQSQGAVLRGLLP
jgi:hypothetical protein